ncbi:fra a 1-associated protein-like [Prosopis cineraria]|uniref:fra a 1-associated protein-like n=1 Tax=Prosopis cineraria TaxID=364024 RepID=UPI0024106CD4|nr:fra a 1-associated protein-like [Prosopis cineraria]
MGWVWRDDDDDQQISSRGISEFGRSDHSEERCSTRKVVKSQCRTEEVEPGKFVRKCEKTEEVLRDCIGKPVEVIQSNKEVTEEDVTDAIQRGGSFMFGSSGLQSDIEAIERNFFGGLSRFFEAAEEMSNGFFDVFARAPRIFDADSSSSTRKGIPIEEFPVRDAFPKSKPKEYVSIDANLSGLAKDV